MGPSYNSDAGEVLAEVLGTSFQVPVGTVGFRPDATYWPVQVISPVAPTTHVPSLNGPHAAASSGSLAACDITAIEIGANPLLDRH